MEFNSLVYKVESGAAYIRFNRPDRLNAVTLELYNEVAGAIEAAERDGAIRVIVLTGEGRAFCVGADLKEHGTAKRTDEHKRAYANAEQRICAKIQQSPKPFVAAVHGYAFGAGAEIALSCDFVVMKSSAEIGFPEISIGTYLGGGLTYMLPRLVGLSRAKELIFLGKRIDGEEAARIGLIHTSASDEEFDHTVKTLIEQLSAVAPIPLGIAKLHLLTHSRIATDDALKAEAEALLRCMETNDWREGVRAFNEKRKPKFTGT